MTEKVTHIYEATIAKKKEKITVDLYKIIDLAIDYTLFLKDDADHETIKLCLKILLDRYKNEYKKVIIKF